MFAWKINKPPPVVLEHITVLSLCCIILCFSAVRAAAARGCVLAFAGWWVALATPAQLALFHNFCLCLGLTAEMRRVDNNVKAVIRARARKVSRGAAVD